MQRTGDVMQRTGDVMQRTGDVMQRTGDVMQRTGDIMHCLPKICALPFAFQFSKPNVVKEAIIVCEKMRRDLASITHLQSRYPGALIQIRYEDVVTNLNTTLDAMFSHLEEKVPASVYDHMMKLMHADEDGSKFSQKRKNAQDSLSKWTLHNSHSDSVHMTEECQDVLLSLGYPVSSAPHTNT